MAIFAGDLFFLLGIFCQEVLSAFHIIWKKIQVKPNCIIKASTIASS